MPSANNFPFRLLTAPFKVPATDEPSQVEVGPTLLATKGIASVSITNSFPIWIRIVGSGSIRAINGAMSGSFIEADEDNSYLIPPAPFWGIFSTTYPIWLSAVAVARPDCPIMDGGSLLYPEAVLEVAYGGGC